jgi:hypothetical protein
MNVSDADLIIAARIAAALAGCTCTPDVDIETVDEIHHAHVRHDPWCRLLNKRAASCN